ncbi:uncharacterized protein LOC129596807 isoform X2 [Paramacrobiotus metropolitanus]|uniref:uncharacterized protein LOC129596807 isoform X2 n=1 Tax=Paramacrobiotus metropolitanus TaxID=2943436 RepID=UPI002445E5A7|nr:uncharacterized protein LOC129596807 isoform X2 [Paramacrobiotus metropolitanus]
MGASASTEAGPMHAAVAEANVSQVRHLCSTAEVSVINQECNGETPLTLALRDCVDIAVLRELLQCPRLEVNKPTTILQNTPLMTAVLLSSLFSSKTSILQKAELIAAHPRCRFALRNRENRTALEMALLTQNFAVIGCLLPGERITQYTPEDIIRMGAWAVKSDNVDLVAAILDSVPEGIQKVLLDLAKEILDNEPAVDAANHPVEPEQNIPPLHCAILRESTVAVQEILQQSDTDVNQKVVGLTPLMLAIFGRSIPIVQMLVDTPFIDINMTSTGFNKITALAMCAFPGGSVDEEDRIKKINAILAHPECDPTLKDEHGVNALGMAAMFGNQKMVDCLIAVGGIDRYAVDDVWRCMRFAISTGYLRLAQTMCDAVRGERHAVLRSRLDPSNAPEALKTAMRIKPHMVNGTLLHYTLKYALRMGRPVVGSHVIIRQDPALVRRKQVEHNLDFEAGMCSCWGTVEMFTSSGDAILKMITAPSLAWKLLVCHPETLVVMSRGKVDTADLLQPRPSRPDNGHGVSTGKLCDILFFNEDGDVCVRVNKTSSFVNRKALRKIGKVLCGDGSLVQVGDKIRVILMETAFQAVQTEEFYGWLPALASLIGATLTVQALWTSASDNPKLMLEVEHNGLEFFLNPQAVGLCDPAQLDIFRSAAEPITDISVHSGIQNVNPEDSMQFSSDLAAIECSALEQPLLQKLDPHNSIS